MTDREQISSMIDAYMNLLRIKKMTNMEMEAVTTEINNQLRSLKAKLEASGIVTEDLFIE